MSEPTGAQTLSEVIRQAGAAADFDLVRIAPAVEPSGFHPLLEWVASGYAADMKWIEKRKDAYRHPDGIMPGTRSVVMVAMNYHDGSPVNSDQPRIASYAAGREDYHSVIRRRLKAVANVIHEQHSDAKTRIVVDTAPLLERDFGRLAGIGWQGKNTMLISRSIGSWFFLGGLLTNVELEYDQPFEGDYCGNCTRCLDVCPTDAFPAAGVLDASRCISYLTIERRDQSIPDDLKTGIENWIFGCDLCQEVCPWNRFAPAECVDEFRSRPELAGLTIDQLLNFDEQSFRAQFADTPLERTGRDVIVRNACIVAANLRLARCKPQLQSLANDTSDLVRESAAWALKQLER